MYILLAKFKRSAKELRRIQNVTICAMLLALRVVVGYFSNLTLAVSPDIKIGFGFLPVALAAIICGPVGGMIVGGLGDILSFMIAPMGYYFPGWTVSGLLVGLLYGIFLYKTKRPLLCLIIVEVVIGIFVEVALGSLWLMVQSQKAFLFMAGVRALKTLVAIPIEIVLVYLFSKVLQKIPQVKIK